MVKKENLLLLVILGIGLILRLYKLDTFYTFDHDQDLFSWIVRDIVVDGHFRLIGQLTSIDGLFIGPLFYYLLVPFFILFKMNPLGALVPAVLLGVFTAFSFYFVISSFFGKKAGLIAAFFYAIPLGSVFYDRWVVPTQPTILWSVWFLYVLLSLLKGNLKVIPLLGLLTGLIWHIHVALLPIVAVAGLACISALKVNKEKIPLKSFAIGVLLLGVFMAPFWLFEFKHGFQQINGLFNSFTESRGELSGLPRFVEIVQSISRLFRGMLWVDNRVITFPAAVFILSGVVLTGFFLKVKKVLRGDQAIFLALWAVVSILSQQISKRPVSEYYFLSIYVPFLLIISLLLGNLYRSFGRKIINISILGFLIWNVFQLVNMPEPTHGFNQKTQTVEYIKKDSLERGYRCIGINYIADFGTGVGFRYLMDWQGIKVIQPSGGVPVYNIVIPWKRSEGEIDARFGTFGVIKPGSENAADQSKCDDLSLYLLPLLGFSN